MDLKYITPDFNLINLGDLDLLSGKSPDPGSDGTPVLPVKPRT